MECSFPDYRGVRKQERAGGPGPSLGAWPGGVAKRGRFWGGRRERERERGNDILLLLLLLKTEKKEKKTGRKEKKGKMMWRFQSASSSSDSDSAGRPEVKGQSHKHL